MGWSVRRGLLSGDPDVSVCGGRTAVAERRLPKHGSAGPGAPRKVGAGRGEKAASPEGSRTRDSQFCTPGSDLLRGSEAELVLAESFLLPFLPPASLPSAVFPTVKTLYPLSFLLCLVWKGLALVRVFSSICCYYFLSWWK